MSQECQRCKSQRVAHVSAKCSDLCSWSLGELEHDGYVPNVGIGGGNYVSFAYCLDCGQIQGEWPRPEQEVRDMQTENLEREIADRRRILANASGIASPENREDLRREIAELEKKMAEFEEKVKKVEKLCS